MLTEVVEANVPMLRDESAATDGILVAFTGRAGGVSGPPFGSLNLSTSVGDDPAHVEENRRRVSTALKVSSSRMVFARQVHGAGVLEANNSGGGVLGEGDVLIATGTGPVLTILTADCVPVILEGSSAIAAVHAGWRGLVAGAIEAAADRIGGIRRAWVGPSIRACCYEVGPEVIAAFRNAGLPVAGDDRVDPGRAAVVALRRTGARSVLSTDICTSCDRGYFSHRRDGSTGRQAALTALLT